MPEAEPVPFLAVDEERKTNSFELKRAITVPLHRLAATSAAGRLTTAAADELHLLRAVETTVLVGSGSQLDFIVRPTREAFRQV